MTKPSVEFDRSMPAGLPDDEALTDIQAACFVAAKDLFPWLSLRDVIAPPHEWFDAALARQIALHLMVKTFFVPKRRVVEMQGRSREAVNRALRTIDERLGEPLFFECYQDLTDRARSLVLETRIRRAA